MIAGQVLAIAEEYLKAQGLELVDIICRYEGRDLFLRILADRPEGGINMDECAMINKELGAVLEEKNIVQERYILEVSSPGLDRPLKTRGDFNRNLNSKAKFFLNEPINEKIEWDGIIKVAAENEILVDINGTEVAIPLSKINKAKLLI